MKYTIFLYFLFQVDFGYTQKQDTAKVFRIPAPGPSMPVYTPDVYINYFPFYNGVQLIEVNYYERSFPRGNQYDSLQRTGGLWKPTFMQDKPNGYLIRNRAGLILRKYGVPDVRKLKLRSPRKAKTITHKQRLENGMVEWYNLNGDRKYTKSLSSGYGYSYRGGDHSYTVIDTFGRERLSDCERIVFIGSNYLVKENGKHAIFDQEFKQRTPFQNKMLNLVAEGIFMRNYEFINIDGELLDTNRYERIIFNRMEDVHMIYLLKGKYGLMDRKLNHLTKPRFKSIKPLGRDDYYVKDGNNILTILNAYSEQLSPSKSIKSLNRNGYCVTNDSNKLAILNADGEQITPFKYQSILQYWRADGYMEVQQKYEVGPSFGIGLIDSTGKEVILPKYNKIELIKNGLGVAHLNGYKGLVNTKGEELTEFIYWDLDIYSTYAISEIAGKYGLLDSTGTEILPTLYKKITIIKEGMAIVQGDNDKFGYISLIGGPDIPMIYTNVGYFFDEVAWVILDGKQGLIDRTGKELTDFQFEHITTYNMREWVVRKDGMYGALDSKGEKNVPLIYTKVELLKDGSTKLSNENKSYILSK